MRVRILSRNFGEKIYKDVKKVLIFETKKSIITDDDSTEMFFKGLSNRVSQQRRRRISDSVS